MTENEAIKEVKFNMSRIGLNENTAKRVTEARDIAIQALEEIQEYKAIGLTPELIEAMQGHNVALINDLGEYQAIGTIDEFKALKEKNETLKALYEDARKEGSHLIARERAKAIDEFAEELKGRLMDAIHQKDVESMTNLINDVAREVKGRWKE